MSTVRLRRLQADFHNLRDYARRHPRLQLVQHDGDPPERYHVQYRIRSLVQKGDQLEEADEHLVEIVLPRNYPRTPPQCRMLTPIFHPNIAPHAICIGDHWSAGEPLVSIVARIGELLAYQSYNTKSPLNGEAARWTAANIERLPLDEVSMLLEESSGGAPVANTPTFAPPAPPLTARPAPPAPAPAVVPPSGNDITVLVCPGCEAQLRARIEEAAKQVRCPRCKTLISVPGRRRST